MHTLCMYIDVSQHLNKRTTTVCRCITFLSIEVVVVSFIVNSLLICIFVNQNKYKKKQLEKSIRKCTKTKNYNKKILSKFVYKYIHTYVRTFVGSTEKLCVE